MATSGITTINATRNTIILRALRLVGAYASGETPGDQDITDANIALNMMLKAWQIQNFIWIKEFVEIPLVASQAEYDIPDYVNTMYRPTRVFNAARKGATGYKVPMTPLSRGDYWDISNTTSLGVPNQYYFDPQTSTAKLYVWPVPSSDSDTLVLDIDRPIQVMIDSSDEFDFPEEWLEPLSYGLAVRISPEYAVPLNERIILEREYTALVKNLIDYNMDHVSTFIGADRG